MRVLAVRLGSYSCTGGIERVCRVSDRILSEAGVELAVVSLWDQPEDMPASTPTARYHGCGRSKARFLWRFLLNLLDGRWDLVWFQHRLLVPLAGVVRLLTRARIMIWVFGWEVWSPPPAIARVGMGLADRVLSISTFTARRCETLYRIPPDRMRVCPLGVTRFLDQLSGEPVPGCPRGPFVLVVSRLGLPDAERKGVFRVCEAMVRVIERIPAASCVVVGEGPARQALQDRVRSLGLEGRVVLTGRLSDAELRWLYRKAAVFALPSTVEGFGLVYVEAMAHHVPVVAGRLDAAVDVVEDGHTGLLVDPMSVEEIAGALVTLLKDDALRGMLGQKAYERVQAQFTEEAMGARLLAVLKELER